MRVYFLDIPAYWVAEFKKRAVETGAVTEENVDLRIWFCKTEE